MLIVWFGTTALRGEHSTEMPDICIIDSATWARMRPA
jgi:hypothetical protein